MSLYETLKIFDFEILERNDELMGQWVHPILVGGGNDGPEKIEIEIKEVKMTLKDIILSGWCPLGFKFYGRVWRRKLTVVEEIGEIKMQEIIRHARIR